MAHSKARITITASSNHPDILEIKDAMRQVMDFFELLSDDSNSNLVWNLEVASTNSPLTVIGNPVDIRTNAGAEGAIAGRLIAINNGWKSVLAGDYWDEDFPEEKKPVIQRMLRRNLNGIGTTALQLGDLDEIEIPKEKADTALSVISRGDDLTYAYLFSRNARTEVGSVEGRILELGTHYEQPALKLKEHKSGNEIWCRVETSDLKKLSEELTAGDVWNHRRVRIRGTIKFNDKGGVVSLSGGTIHYIEPKNVTVADLVDSSFTGKLNVKDYLDRLREGDFG